MESTVKNFANFIGNSVKIEIPDEAYRSAKLIVADCLAAIVGGMAEPEMCKLTESEIGSDGNFFKALKNRKKITEENISFVLGTAGTVLEMDEGHQFAKGHPGMHVFPASDFEEVN